MSNQYLLRENIRHNDLSKIILSAPTLDKYTRARSNVNTTECMHIAQEGNNNE